MARICKCGYFFDQIYVLRVSVVMMTTTTWSQNPKLNLFRWSLVPRKCHIVQPADSDCPFSVLRVAPRSSNPYMTPISNPRHVDHTAATPSLRNVSPIPAIDSYMEIAPNEDGLTDEGIGELLRATATSRGRLNYYYHKFKAACQKVSFLLCVGDVPHAVPFR